MRKVRLLGSDPQFDEVAQAANNDGFIETKIGTITQAFLVQYCISISFLWLFP